MSTINGYRKMSSIDIQSCSNLCVKRHTRLNRETANVTQPLYSSGLRLTKASIKLTAAVATP
jgi:hypothetical protein